MFEFVIILCLIVLILVICIRAKVKSIRNEVQKAYDDLRVAKDNLRLAKCRLGKIENMPPVPEECNIFTFDKSYHNNMSAVFIDCNLNEQVGMHQEGTYFPVITIHIATGGMTFFDDNGSVVGYYSLKKDFSL